MRYSSAMVLSTLAVGQAAASHLNNRHASFHARRQAEAKRSAAGDVNWDAVAYDLKDVDWDKVNWSSVFASPTAAPVVEAPKATPTAQQPKADSKPASKPTSEAAAPAPTSAAAAPSAKAQSVSSNNKAVSNLLAGVEAIASAVGAKIGTNSQTNNGGIWVGSDSAWTAEFTNDGNSDLALYCWKANGYSGMSVNANTPDISVGLGAGESIQLSFAANVPAACAPAYKGTKLALFGGWDQTWFEVTFGQYGAFDISRNVNMNGNSISAKGSKCTSDMNTCVFKCKDSSASSCEAGTDYDLFNCGASTGGGGGYDAAMAGTGGGCAMGSSGEKINVVFS